MSVAVIGIGQRLRGDDAAGLEAVQLWERQHVETAGRPDVRIAIIEGSGLELLELLGEVDSAVLVDAVRSQAPAGTVHRIGPEALADFQAKQAAAHNWGIEEVLQLGRALDPKSSPPAVRLLGVEAERVDLGAGLSETVQGALPALCEAIEHEVTSLLEA